MYNNCFNSFCLFINFIQARELHSIFNAIDPLYTEPSFIVKQTEI